nr:DUF1566 domain-containing protein [Aliikangiella coralliicola]
MVVDTVNNLTWQDSGDNQLLSLNWNDATNYCDNLSHDGRNDWRLPTALELFYLVDFKVSLGDGDAKIDSAFANALASDYWSADTDNVSGSQLSMAVNFDSGLRSQSSINSDKAVRCVSGVPRFEGHFSRFKGYLPDVNVVIDSVNRLMWQDTSEVGTEFYTYAQALTYCENLELDGSTDWRLPNINELQSTFDSLISFPVSAFKYNPGINADFWSSTSAHNDANKAHVIWASSGNGNHRLSTKTNNFGDPENYARCVRDFSAPVALGADDRTVSVGSLVTLDASESHDPDGEIVTYRWFDLTSGRRLLSLEVVYSTSSLSLGEHQLELHLTDNNGLVTAVPFTVTVVAEPNVAPVASSQSVSVNEDESIDITLQATDGNGDTLSYQLVDLPANGSAVLVGQNTVTYTPNANYFGNDSFTFKANDGALDSNVAMVTIDVIAVNDGPPVADAGDDQTILVGEAVNFDATGSSDDTGIATYEWTFGGQLLSNEAQFTKEDFSAGVHTVTLTVVDTEGLSSTDTVVVNVNYPLQQCQATEVEDDFDFVDSYPQDDIAWSGANFSDVTEIEKAFNHARRIDSTIWQYLKMPEQAQWDSYTLQQKALFLVNSERKARGLKPYAGVSPRVATVAQDFADYLRTNNEVITHTRSSDGASHQDRLEEDPYIQENHEGAFENIYANYQTISAGEAIVGAIYQWTYEDKFPASGASWGHRSAILWVGFNENNDSPFTEGLVGFGVSIGAYQPPGSVGDGQGAVVVMNGIDQKAAWTHNDTIDVDISEASQCNNEVELFLDESVIDTNGLSALIISPTNIALNPGDVQSLTVTGLYQDGSTQDLTSAVSFTADNSSIVQVDNGVITALNFGQVSLYTTFNGFSSNRINVFVGEPTDLTNLADTFAEDYLQYIPSNTTIKHYDPKAFSLFTGQVNDRNGVGVSGVMISFYRQPEFGSVVTDEQGRFIIAGQAGPRTIVYRKDGYLTLHREIIAASSAWAVLDDVIVLPVDSKATAIDLTATETQVHHSSVVTDGSGSRSKTIVFDGVNQVTITSPDGSTRNFNNFMVRATEYELPASMPADLPAESAFTYCAELEIPGVGDDEMVSFDKPVTLYTDNFLNFAVGEIIPVGYYDRQPGGWKASENGVVVKMLDANGDGVIDGLDYTGDDIADDIDGDGDSSDEVAGTSAFSPGETYWRSQMDHFSAQDENLNGQSGGGMPFLGYIVINEDSQEDPEKDNEKTCANSYIKHRPQAFHEDIAITGTGLTLHYSSQRTANYHHKIEVAVSEDKLPPAVIEMIAVLEIGGHRFEQKFAPALMQDATFTWNGESVDGEYIRGAVVGKISIGYRYATEYMSAGNAATSSQPLESFPNAWAQVGSSSTGVSGRDSEIIWSVDSIRLMNAPNTHFAEGWSLSNHHIKTPFNKVYLGNGDAVEVEDASLVLKTGITHSLHTGDDGYYQKGGSEIDYEVNADGVLVDKVTGLKWQYLTQSAARFKLKSEAQAYCENLQLGEGIWRLPTYKELAYAIDKSRRQHDFPIYNFEALSHWNKARVDNDEYSPVMCVQGESLDIRYAAGLKRNATDNVVVDEENGLMWQDVAENASVTRDWKASIDYCEALDHAGYSDWRLPNINELAYALPNTTFIHQTVLDNGGTGESWYPGVSFRKPYWASTPNVSSDVGAWAIESPAYAWPYTQDEQFYARCVRDDLTRARSPYVFDQAGKHIKTIDLNSGITLTTFEYDDQNRLIAVKDRFDNTVIINRDTDGKVLDIVSPDGYKTKLTVDENNDLRRVEYDDQSGYDFVYQNSLMTEETDPKGNQFVKTYNTLGRVEQVEDPEGGVWGFFNAKDEATKIVSYGITTAENTRFETQESRLANGDTSYTTTHQDLSQTGIIRQADDLKETFTGSGVVTVIDKVIDTKTRQEIPHTITTTLPSGLISTSQVEKIYGENGTDLSQLTLELTQNGKVSQVFSNFVNGQKTVTSAEGRTTTSTFDPITQLITGQQITGLNAVSFDYDDRGRLTQMSVGDRSVTYAFDDAVSKGQLTSFTDSLQRTTAFEYDALGRLKKTIYPDGSELLQTWDANGNLATLQPPGQPVHRFNYNSVNKEKQYTPPAVSGVTKPETVYDYDKDRKLTKITRPDNQEIGFNYKPGTDQLSSVDIPRGSYTYGYDGHGNVGSITAPDNGQLSFDYDGSLLIEQTWAENIVGKVSQSYNADFLVDEQCVNTSDCVSYGYDDDNLLVSAGGLTISREVQKAGLINGTMLNKISTNIDYNLFGEMSGSSSVYDNNTNLFETTYVHDKLGRIRQKTETIEGSSSTEIYTYDDVGRIETVTRGNDTTTYTYDGNGNRLTKVKDGSTETGVYDAQDRLLSYAGNTYSYSDDGELKSKTDTIISQTTTYTYDVLGNLTSVVIPNGQSNTTIDYIVDGRNRRIGKKVNGTLLQSFLYSDKLNPIAELNGNNQIVSRFVYGTKINVPDYLIKGGVTYRIISDYLGSPRLVVNAANGDIVQRMDYDEFGVVTNDTNPGFQPFGFAGGIYDRDTKLVRFGARDYDAAVGRWTKKDPIRFSGGDSNIYGYVFSDPINLIDPGGKLAFVVPFVPWIITGTDLAIVGLGGACIFTNCTKEAGEALSDIVNQYNEEADDSKEVDCDKGEDGRLKDRPHGYMPGDKGAEKWGRKEGVGAKEGRRRFHEIKWDDNMAGAKENYWVDPNTGDVIDPAGDWVGNLNDG